MFACIGGLNYLPFLFIGLATRRVGLCPAGFARAPLSMPVPAPGTTGRLGVAGGGRSRRPLAYQVLIRAIGTGQVFMNDRREQMDQAGRFGVDVKRLNQGSKFLTLVITLDKVIHLLRGQVCQFLVRRSHHCPQLSPKQIILSGNCPIKMIIALSHSVSPSDVLPTIDAGPLLTSLGNRKVPVYSSGWGSYPRPLLTVVFNG